MLKEALATGLLLLAEPFTPPGFKLASDGAAGTAVTYISATAAHTDVLAKEG